MKTRYEKDGIVSESIVIITIIVIIIIIIYNIIIIIIIIIIISAIYYQCIGLLVGALYCTAPQGRIGGIEVMKLGQAHEIFQKGNLYNYRYKKHIIQLLQILTKDRPWSYHRRPETNTVFSLLHSHLSVW